MAETPPVPEQFNAQRPYDIGLLCHRYSIATEPGKIPSSLTDLDKLKSITNPTLPEIEDYFAGQDAFQKSLTSMAEKNPRKALDKVYQALFKRGVDKVGEQIYMDQLNNGRLIYQIIDEIRHSTEYQTRALSQTYQDLLHRDPDPEGQKIYLDQLKDGRSIHVIAEEIRNSEEYKAIPGKSKGVLTYFGKPLGEVPMAAPERKYQRTTYNLEDLFARFYPGKDRKSAPEHLVLRAIRGGATYTEIEDELTRDPLFVQRLRDAAPEDAVNMLYRALLKRDPDPDGRQIYIDHLMRGRHNDPIVLREILGSHEYRDRIVTQLYQEVLERDPDPEGLRIYTDQLVGDNPRPVSGIAVELEESDEYKNMQNRNKKKVLQRGISVHDWNFAVRKLVGSVNEGGHDFVQGFKDGFNDRKDNIHTEAGNKIQDLRNRLKNLGR